MLKEQKETQRPDPLQNLMASLPFHDEGSDPIIGFSTGR